MKTFIFPVVRMATTTGHIRVQAETLEQAHRQAHNQVDQSKGFRSHYSTTTTFEIKPHSQSYQRLLGDTE